MENGSSFNLKMQDSILNGSTSPSVFRLQGAKKKKEKKKTKSTRFAVEVIGGD